MIAKEIGRLISQLALLHNKLPGLYPPESKIGLGLMQNTLTDAIDTLKDRDEQLKEAQKKLDFIRSKGIVITYMKTSDKSHPYLVYVVQDGSEFDDKHIVNRNIELELEVTKLQSEVATLKRELSGRPDIGDHK
jgi:hypothetical protein